MKKIDAIVVDDEESARNVLCNLLNRCCPEINVVTTCTNLPEAVEQIRLLKPEVVFLDVQMPDFAGYEIVDFFESTPFEIIFVTAFDQYAIKAFELSAIDYLVKPVHRGRLVDAVEKLKDRLGGKNAIEKYRVLLDSIKRKEFEKIVIPELGGKRVLQLKNIIAIEAKGSYSKIHLREDKSIVVSKSLKYFETVLPENAAFFRSHKSWIIHLSHIESYSSKNHEILLSGGITANLSKYRMSQFEAVVSDRR